MSWRNSRRVQGRPVSAEGPPRRRGNEVWRKCFGCRRNIRRSEPCWYDRDTDTARCSECGPHREEEVPHGVA